MKLKDSEAFYNGKQPYIHINEGYSFVVLIEQQRECRLKESGYSSIIFLAIVWFDTGMVMRNNGTLCNG